MNDAQTTIQQLRDLVEEFVSQRNWHRYHAPKNLTMALAIEAAELMEHYQWLDVEESRCEVGQVDKTGIANELADVVCYALALANALQIDLATAIAEKMEKNREKYPVERYFGKAK
jgi:NTP pyrophosphatase (non-canonical NTP hydrolase)